MPNATKSRRVGTTSLSSKTQDFLRAFADHLIVATGSDVVLLQFRHRDDDPANFHLHDEYVSEGDAAIGEEIPRGKDADVWEVQYPYHTCGLANYEGRSRAHAAYFPLFLDCEWIAFFILVRRDRFHLREVGQYWFLSQSVISKELTDSEVHTKFSATADSLKFLRNPEVIQPEHFWHGLSHCLTSTSGLAWDRFAIFEEQKKQGEFTCIFAHGALTKLEWEETKRRAYRNSPEGYRKSIRRETRLTSRTLSDTPIIPALQERKITLTENERTTLFTSSNAIVPVQPMLDGKWPGWNPGVTKSVEEDSDRLWFPLTTNHKNFLAILTCFHSPVPPLLLTSSFLCYVSSVYSEWSLGAEVVQLTKPSHDAFPKRLRASTP